MTPAFVGRAHGIDGKFWVEGELPPGACVDGIPVERVGGTEERPLARAEGVEDRDAAVALAGRPVLGDEEPLAEDEWLVSDLVGAEVVGVGYVERVIAAPSCDVLEVGEVLIPFVRDAITKVEPGRIEINREFLGL